MLKPLPVWKVYVPSTDGYRNEWDIEKHKEWDKEVCRITGGLTLLKVEEGRWVDPNGKMLPEPMLPVMIACTRKQLFEILKFTKKHYNQKAVIAMKISDEAWILSGDEL